MFVATGNLVPAMLPTSRDTTNVHTIMLFASAFRPRTDKKQNDHGDRDDLYACPHADGVAGYQSYFSNERDGALA
jgi:hypothetical protein